MSYTPVQVNGDSTTTPTTTVNGSGGGTGERPNQHNHHHHHKNKAYYERLREASWATWICLGFFFVFFVAITITLIVYCVQWNNTNNHIYALEQKLAMEKSRLTSNGIYTVSNSAEHHKIQYDISLCHMEMYQLSDTGDDPILTKPKNITEARERGGEDDDTFQARVFLSMRYNVEADQLLAQSNVKGRVRGKYMILNYEFLTNYAEFSTVRLVEKTYDFYRKQNIVTKDVLLCSDNPSKRSHATRCSRMTDADGIMLLNNTDFYPMDNARKLAIRGSLSPTSTNSRDAVEDVEPIEEEEEERGEEEEVPVLEEEISDSRFYELYCYRETDDKDDDFNEYLSLIITPEKCN